ncbi:hypothetical protein Lepto7375DRAFT_7209 [Leptolyngbya sp. PCC 7375]|nr:hypothetical protein Lepto7375DRAFT_7209 [Leptolyngbya sp. PCC 7375]
MLTVSLNSKGCILYASDCLFQLLGYPGESVIRRRLTDFISSEREISGNMLIEYIFIRKSGEKLSVITNRTPVIFNERLIGFLITAIDPVDVWINAQTSDIQLLLTNLTVRMEKDCDILIECPNSYWFGLIAAMSHHFRCVENLELSVPATGDFQVIPCQEQLSHIPVPISQPN